MKKVYVLTQFYCFQLRKWMTGNFSKTGDVLMKLKLKKEEKRKNKLETY